MSLQYAGHSMAGAVRRRNEDAVLMVSDGDDGLFLVADGIGGSANGAEASDLIAKRYKEWWEGKTSTISFSRAVDEIREVLFELNKEIYGKYGKFHSGSTIVLLYIHGQNCLWLSSGDSRIYRVRRMTCKQLTKDDTFENLAEKPAGYGVENNGKLVGAVGIRDTVDYSMKTEPVMSGDRFLLCSDGVYKYHAPAALKRKMTLPGRCASPEKVVDSISCGVMKHGAGDNFSMIFVRVP